MCRMNAGMRGQSAEDSDSRKQYQDHGLQAEEPSDNGLDSVHTAGRLAGARRAVDDSYDVAGVGFMYLRTATMAKPQSRV